MVDEYTYNINDMLADAMALLPGAADAVIKRQMALTIREFFERSYAWVEVINDTPLQTGDTEHQIDATGKIGSNDDDAIVLAVLNCAVGTAADGFEPLKPLGGEPLKVEGSNSRPYAWYVASNPDTLKVYPYYTGSETLYLRTLVALMPDTDVFPFGGSSQFPRQFEYKWYDAIMNGLLARMYMQTDKPYSNPSEGFRLRHNFLRQIGFYAAQRKKGYNNSQVWRYPAGWSPKLRRG